MAEVGSLSWTVKNPTKAFIERAFANRDQSIVNARKKSICEVFPLQWQSGNLTI